MRAARTPPEPPPMTNRSTSYSAIVSPARNHRPGSKASRTGSWIRSDFLAALLHLGAELAVDDRGKILRPLVHIGHAELERTGLGHQQFGAERRFVEGHELLQ